MLVRVCKVRVTFEVLRYFKDRGWVVRAFPLLHSGEKVCMQLQALMRPIKRSLL
jgi:hypothetical protein